MNHSTCSSSAPKMGVCHTLTFRICRHCQTQKIKLMTVVCQDALRPRLGWISSQDALEACRSQARTSSHDDPGSCCTLMRLMSTVRDTLFRVAVKYCVSVLQVCGKEKVFEFVNTHIVPRNAHLRMPIWPMMTLDHGRDQKSTLPDVSLPINEAAVTVATVDLRHLRRL